MRCPPSPDTAGWTEVCSIMQGDKALCLNVKALRAPHPPAWVRCMRPMIREGIYACAYRTC